MRRPYAFGTGLVLCLAVGHWARGQQAPDRPPDTFVNFFRADAAAERSEVHENVEVFRRLLDRKLRDFLPNQGLVQAGTAENVAHWLGTFYQNPATSAQSSTYFAPNVTANQNALRQPVYTAVPLPVEGVYLNGVGAIFTLTLPTSARQAKTQGDKPPRPKVSDWERAQAEVRGTKAEEPKPSGPAARSLRDVIGKLMADNAAHLARFGNGVTVVVTFRDPPAPVGYSLDRSRAVGDLFTNGLPASVDLIDYGAANRRGPTSSGGDVNKPGTPVGGTGSPDGGSLTVPVEAPSSARDHVLLGGLLLKQGKYDEAQSTLKKASELLGDSPDTNPLKEDLLQKLAQAYLAKGEVESASQALERVKQAKKSQTSRKGEDAAKDEVKPAPLPDKLIVAAPQNLLIQYAQGKMNFEDFWKQVVVQGLEFPKK